MIKKFVSPILMVALVVMSSGILLSPSVAMAATVTTASDIMSRQRASTLSNHEIKFVTSTGVAAGQSISLTFSTGFTGVSSVAFGDVDFASGSTNDCSTSAFTEKTLAGTQSGTTWGASSSGQIVTILSGTDTIAAARCVRIRIGDNAVTGATGVNRITNGAAGSTDIITIGGTFTDTGVITVEIDDNDQVTIAAQVNSLISFDLDTGITNAEMGPTYTVDFGVIGTGATAVSNHSSINSIYASGGTNSAGGMNVTVQNVNGANGLVSTSKNTDKIPSNAGTMAAGTANYGLCVATVTGWARAGSYTSTSCVAGTQTNVIPALTTTPASILSSTAPTPTLSAEILANAAISITTPAHPDYADTLTFIATASF